MFLLFFVLCCSINLLLFYMARSQNMMDAVLILTSKKYKSNAEGTMNENENENEIEIESESESDDVSESDEGQNGSLEESEESEESQKSSNLHNQSVQLEKIKETQADSERLSINKNKNYPQIVSRSCAFSATSTTMSTVPTIPGTKSINNNNMELNDNNKIDGINIKINENNGRINDIDTINVIENVFELNSTTNIDMNALKDSMSPISKTNNDIDVEPSQQTLL